MYPYYLDTKVNKKVIFFLFKDKYQSEDFFGIPFEVLIDVENSFGYLSFEETENPAWNETLTEDLKRWVGKNRYILNIFL